MMWGGIWEKLFKTILILQGRSDHLPVSLKNDSMQQPDYLLLLPKSNQDDRNEHLST